jgi:hypothetical protein
VEELALRVAAVALVEPDVLRRGAVRLSAVVADPAQEPLADHADDGGSDQERLDAHVEEPVQRSDGINVQTSAGTRFVDADQVDRIFTTYVTTTLSWDQTANLPGPR